MPHRDPVEAPPTSRPAWDAQAPLAAPGAAAAAPVPEPAVAHRRSAARVVGGTIVVALLASGVLEYQGWQIIFRTAPSIPSDIPFGAFALGTLRTLGGALGIGAGVGIAGLLVPGLRRHPWRTLAAGLAVGAAAFLGFLGWLTSLAP